MHEDDDRFQNRGALNESYLHEDDEKNSNNNLKVHLVSPH